MTNTRTKITRRTTGAARHSTEAGAGKAISEKSTAATQEQHEGHNATNVHGAAAS